MIKKIVFMFVIVLVTNQVSAQWAPVSVQTTDNKTITIEEIKGKTLTVVDFWATWCKPCLAAMKSLNTIYPDYRAKGVEFVGVNIDGPRNQAKVSPMVRAMKIDYPIVLDPAQALMTEWNLSVTPSIVLLNSDGKVLWVHEGYQPGDEAEIRKELDKWLNQ